MVTALNAGQVYNLMVLILFSIKGSQPYLYSCDSNVACGCSTNPALVNRIVGGETANVGTWGWAVSIYIAPGSLCGGSILSSTWILTAAHCVDKAYASQVTVFAGSNSMFTGQSRSVANIIVHTRYNENTNENDIALLRLSTPFEMTDPNVKSICLPSISRSVYSAGEWPAAGQYVVTVGWGRLQESGSASSSLQQVTVQTIAWNVSTCYADLNNPTLQFCAGVTGGGKDACQGDSGGPIMMFTSSNQWVQVGITSYGYGCARANHPGIYTRLVYYQDWIRSLTSSSYTTPTSSNSANINPYSSASVSTSKSTLKTTRPASISTRVTTTNTNTITGVPSNSAPCLRKISFSASALFPVYAVLFLCR